ncbi:MAG: retropepsin-like aspartic protease [Thermoanaerobaculia bacterium]
MVLIAGCSDGRDSTVLVREPQANRRELLQSLHTARDYFALREILDEYIPDSSETLFFQAAVYQAFNKPNQSNYAIDRALVGLDEFDPLLARLLELRLANFVHLHDYPSVLEVAERLVELPAGTSASIDLKSVRDISLISKHLAGFAPQEALVHDSSLIELQQSHIPLQIEGHHRSYAFDTGANYSVLMRSEAEALGLSVINVGLSVDTSTDLTVTADLAIAGRLSIGSIDYRNVAFLVFPDEALTFPGGFQIHGLIGFPVIEAMGEVRFHRSGLLEVPLESATDARNTLALVGLDPVILVGYKDSEFICRLDTGANSTTFYEPFFRRFQSMIVREGTPSVARTGGVGGVREFSAYRLSDVELELGGRVASLENVDVYPTSIVEREEENYLYCNVGRDILSQFDEYRINFRTMSFSLR